MLESNPAVNFYSVFLLSLDTYLFIINCFVLTIQNRVYNSFKRKKTKKENNLINLEVYGSGEKATFQMRGCVPFMGKNIPLKTIDNTVFFNGKDVCEALNLDLDAIKKHCRGTIDKTYIPFRDVFRLSRRSKSNFSELFYLYIHKLTWIPLVSALDEVGYYEF